MKAITWDWSRLEKIAERQVRRKMSVEELQAIVKQCDAMKMKELGFLFVWDERAEG